jgi:hypothetical protein
MDEAVLGIVEKVLQLDSQNFTIVLAFGLIAFLFLANQNMPKRYLKLQEINEKTFAQWLDYVDGIMTQIINLSAERSRKIINREYKKDKDVCAQCGSPTTAPEPDAQVANYTNRLREILLVGIVKNKLKLAYRQNGFHEMNAEDYRVYIVDKSHALLNETRVALSGYIKEFPYLIGSDEERMTQKEVFPFVEKIFDKAIALKDTKTKLEKKVMEETSHTAFFGIIVRAFSTIKK